MWVKIKLVFVASIALFVSMVAGVTTPTPEDNITDLDSQEPSPVGIEESIGEQIAVLQAAGEGPDSNDVNTIADVRNVVNEGEEMSNRANQKEAVAPPEPDEDMLSPEILVMSSDGERFVPEGVEFTPIPLETVTMQFEMEGSGREPLVDDIGGISPTEVEVSGF